MANDKAVQVYIDQLKQYEDIVAACNRCGFCTSYCPTYNNTGSETHSPRGRNQAFRALLEGRLTDPAQTREIVETCILCGECTSICFSEVPTAHLMVQARHLLNQSEGTPKILTWALTRVLPHPALFGFFLRSAFLAKKIGVSFLLRVTGVLKLVAPKLAAADKMMKRVPLRFFRDYAKTKSFQERTYRARENEILVAQQKVAFLKSNKKKVSPALQRISSSVVKRPKIAYFPVCGSQYARPSIALSTCRLFEALKIDFIVPEGICCGLPAASYGVLDAVRSMASENLLRLERGRYDAIIADDSSCMAHLKDYPKYFQHDPVMYAKAHAVTQKLRELSGYLVQSGLVDILKRASWNGGPVAYHDPCKAQYGQKVVDPPRELLGVIKGLTLVPIPDSDQCCGGGGTYSFVQPEMSQGISDRKIKNIGSTGCQYLVTSATSCLIQISAGLREKYPAIEALHLSEFLVRVLTKSR